MSRKHRPRAGLDRLAARLYDDDGVDPRRAFDRRTERVGIDRKTQQLCRQAARAIGFALAGEVGDPRLAEVQVLDVRPAPDAGRLCVTVASPGGCRRDEVLARLQAIRGILRAALAAGSHRRRTPELTFEVRGAAEQGDGA